MSKKIGVRFAFLTALLVSSTSFALTLPLPQLYWGKNPDQPWGKKRAITQADRALLNAYRSAHKTAAYETNFTDLAALQAEWQLKTEKPWAAKSCRLPANAVATPNGLLLKTTETQDCGPKLKWATASIWSNFKQKYGFFVTRMKIGDIAGLNNAFWMTTDDGFEIDSPEIHYPNQASTVLHYWNHEGKDTSIGFRQNTNDNLSGDFHEYGLLWTPDVLLFEIDGEPISAMETKNMINGPARIRFSSLLADFAGKIPDHPEGHNMAVQYLRVYPL